jgi:hypothetical protein
MTLRQPYACSATSGQYVPFCYTQSRSSQKMAILGTAGVLPLLPIFCVSCSVLPSSYCRERAHNSQETGSRSPRKSLDRKAGRLGAPDRPIYPCWNPQAAMCKWSGLPNPKASCEVLKFHTHHGQTPSEITERKPTNNFAEYTTSRLHGHSRTPRRRFFDDPTAQNNIILLRRQLSKLHSFYTSPILILVPPTSSLFYSPPSPTLYRPSRWLI